MKKKWIVLIAAVVVLALVGYIFLPGLLIKWAAQSERDAAGVQEKTVRVGDHDIVYLEGGQGETILMIHGFAANKDNWPRFAKWIGPAYHVVALDLPGFGESTCSDDAAYTIVEQVKRVNGFADALGLKKFHIVGNSMGGHIAGRYTLMFPEKVLTLGLFATAGVEAPTPSKLAKRMAGGEPNPLIAETVEEFDRLIEFVFSTPPEIPGFIKKQLVDEAREHKANNQRIFKQIHDKKESLDQDLPKIKVRTFVLWGDQDRVLDVSCVRKLEKGIPDCTVVTMKDCGHLPMLERPREAAEHYMAFLKAP